MCTYWVWNEILIAYYFNSCQKIITCNMSTSKINSEIRGYKPKKSADNCSATQIELSEMQQEMSSQQSLSSYNTFKDLNPQLKVRKWG